ncbi:hypothetical protein G6F57_020497 [Rhizopus arrhizus]|nr:hypothetical protein G6F57_020497 [Rhizopus arrhizus]
MTPDLAVGRFLQHRRHQFEHVAHHRSNERDDHDRQDQASREDADAERRTREDAPDDGHAAQGGDQEGLHVLLEHRHEDEQAPHAVDDRRDRGQHFHGGAERAAQPGRRQLGQEDGDAERDGHRDDQRNGRATGTTGRIWPAIRGCRRSGIRESPPAG